jgi:hypothetical protein
MAFRFTETQYAGPEPLEHTDGDRFEFGQGGILGVHYLALTPITRAQRRIKTWVGAVLAHRMHRPQAIQPPRRPTLNPVRRSDS